MRNDAAKRQRADNEHSERGLCDDLPPLRRDAGARPLIYGGRMTADDFDAIMRRAFGSKL